LGAKKRINALAPIAWTYLTRWRVGFGFNRKIVGKWWELICGDACHTSGQLVEVIAARTFGTYMAF